MHRILFVCYGNICRSPMAEFIMKDLVNKRGLENAFHIESRGTSAAEHGRPMSLSSAAELKKHGVGYTNRTAIHLTTEDYEHCDLLIAMDSMNVRSIRSLSGGDPAGKVYTMMEHTARGGEVDDPWYTRRFDIAYRDIFEGCTAWLERLTAE
jgi:protein-tyrosine phosphatase